MNLITLWQMRSWNPIAVYFSPWRRKSNRIILCTIYGSVLLTFYMVLKGYLDSHMSVAVIALMGVLTVPAVFLSTATRRSGESLEQLYMTRMRREEVLFGSVLGPMSLALNLCIVFSLLLFAIGVRMIGLGMGFLTALLYFTTICNLCTKALRMWLTFPQSRFMVLPITLAMAAFETVLAYAVAFAINISWDGFGTMPFFLTYGLGMIGLSMLNLRVASVWGEKLFYREIEHVSVRQLFLVNIFRRAVISEAPIPYPEPRRASAQVDAPPAIGVHPLDPSNSFSEAKPSSLQ